MILSLEEPEVGLTVVKLTQTNVPEEDRYVVFHRSIVTYLSRLILVHIPVVCVKVCICSEDYRLFEDGHSRGAIHDVSCRCNIFTDANPSILAGTGM